jgi:glycolate dehydrogenase iron-sulfur subunit
MHPEQAGQLGDRKAMSIVPLGADLVAAGNPGCVLQISAALRRAGSSLPVCHTVELLDASLRPTLIPDKSDCNLSKPDSPDSR